MFLDPEKSLTMFSSKGKLDHCDNALRAAMNGSLSIACSSSDGCVVVSFKNVSPLIEKSKFYKVFTICPSIVVYYSGLQPDFRAQLSIAQRICQEYFDVFEVFPSLETFVQEYSLTVQEHTQKGGFRPFGTFLTFIGANPSDPCCYQIDPSGSFRQIPVVTSGVGYDEARKFMERRIELLDDNLFNCLLALKEFSGKDMTPEDVSIGVYKNSSKQAHVYDLESIKELFDSIKS